MHLIAAIVLAASLVTAPAPAAEPDPRWEFFTADKTFYRSPWYRHAHRIMIPFGCTRAPYYSPDPRCTRNRGFHHGIDIAMPCGTLLRSNRKAWVVSNDSLGPAYGRHPILLRNYKYRFDLVIGHTRKVFVKPGDRIRPGMALGRASDSAAPDGCHLHFERRALAGSLDTAVSPRRMLRLRPKG
jgi:murein DD-endopeptidase MepM/ murein hydrolase activator NlpD